MHPSGVTEIEFEKERSYHELDSESFRDLFFENWKTQKAELVFEGETVALELKNPEYDGDVYYQVLGEPKTFEEMKGTLVITGGLK